MSMHNHRRTFLLLLFLSICAAVPVANYLHDLRQENASPADLYQVVYTQLNAFRAGDFKLAYSRASLGMQQKFNPAQFEEMIRRDYAGITGAGHIEFGIVKRRGQHALIQVFFIENDGSVLPCIYSLIYEADGWKIDGARMLPRQPSGLQSVEIRA
jgi:hypothetical protein